LTRINDVNASVADRAGSASEEERMLRSLGLEWIEPENRNGRFIEQKVFAQSMGF
jgi:DNA polymerase/3'-5' exonuclease PolX